MRNTECSNYSVCLTNNFPNCAWWGFVDMRLCKLWLGEKLLQSKCDSKPSSKQQSLTQTPDQIHLFGMLTFKITCILQVRTLWNASYIGRYYRCTHSKFLMISRCAFCLYLICVTVAWSTSPYIRVRKSQIRHSICSIHKIEIYLIPFIALNYKRKSARKGTLIPLEC